MGERGIDERVFEGRGGSGERSVERDVEDLGEGEVSRLRGLQLLDYGS